MRHARHAQNRGYGMFLENMLFNVKVIRENREHCVCVTDSFAHQTAQSDKRCQLVVVVFTRRHGNVALETIHACRRVIQQKAAKHTKTWFVII
jgi:hypothetical protein